MATKKETVTPLMRQHQEIKNRYPDAILLFRVGDFYETFGPDAEIASKVLGITLTKRSNGAASSIALAGFPHHALDTYLHKLVKAGYRVAICDQLEDPKQAKGIVKRGVTELVTPGVASADKLLDHKSNNFLAALHLTDGICGVAFVDISTGEFYAAEGDAAYMDKLLQSFQPTEVLISKTQQRRFKEQFDSRMYTFALEDWVYKERYGYELLTRHFETQSLKGFSLEDLKAATTAAGAAMHYLKDTEHPDLQHISSIQRIVADSFLWMDRFTIRNLELMQSANGEGGGLLDAIDATLTPMGGRLLKRWMHFPLFDLQAIEDRLAVVAWLIKNGDTALKLMHHLKGMGDVERLISKVPLRKANPREVLQLSLSLGHMEEVHNIIKAVEDCPPLHNLCKELSPCRELQDKINTTLQADAPAVASKGGLVKEGLLPELDELRNIRRDGKNYLLKLQQKEAANTGITSLKVAFNNVFGYYLEVTHVHKDKVPADWIRKQTLTTAERYITPELKEYEEKILGAEEKIMALELDMYAQLLSAIEPFIGTIQANAYRIAVLDCLLSFAHTAQQHNYRQPTLTKDANLSIKDGRHPVIEQNLPAGEPYVGNDLVLDKDNQQVIILTGPNMSGKSALLRQTALIVVMAHMGSFVPAESAVIGLTDKIFTRVGASDNLSGGESTFMVEMNETASIVNNLSERSLVLLDEIGRGTSTYDGISIAWSLAEHLHEHVAAPKTLFATHYHELNDLEGQLPRVKNYHISHQENGNKVIFLRKLTPGGSRHSFGIQVARMAGMPPQMLSRAEDLLGQLEARNAAGNASGEKLKKSNTSNNNFQLNIFDGLTDDLKKIRQLLSDTDINTLTPVEALLKLNELQMVVKDYN